MTTKVQTFVTLNRLASYNEGYKQEFRKHGRSILRILARDMGLKKGEFDIRWNPGGIAVSGDHTLHTDKIYVAFHDNLQTGCFYWRTCKGRKDYTGGPNQIVYFTELMNGGWESFVETLKKAQAV